MVRCVGSADTYSLCFEGWPKALPVSALRVAEGAPLDGMHRCHPIDAEVRICASIGCRLHHIDVYGSVRRRRQRRFWRGREQRAASQVDPQADIASTFLSQTQPLLQMWTCRTRRSPVHRVGAVDRPRWSIETARRCSAGFIVLVADLLRGRHQGLIAGLRTRDCPTRGRTGGASRAGLLVVCEIVARRSSGRRYRLGPRPLWSRNAAPEPQLEWPPWTGRTRSRLPRTLVTAIM